MSLSSCEATPLLPTPTQILGANTAVWLQGDLDTGRSPGPLPMWPNQIANGNAIQTPNPDPPQLVLNAFGTKAGVSFLTADSGLEIHVTTPFAAGSRPWMIARVALTLLDHTPGQVQMLYQMVADPFVGGDSINVDAEASGTFDANSYWNLNGTNQETFTTMAPPSGDARLLGAHTVAAACQQSGALVIDGVSVDAPGPVNALGADINRIRINRPVVIEGSSGFFTIGVMIFAFERPSAAQIAQLEAYCDAYM